MKIQSTLRPIKDIHLCLLSTTNPKGAYSGKAQQLIFGGTNWNNNNTNKTGKWNFSTIHLHVHEDKFAHSSRFISAPDFRQTWTMLLISARSLTSPSIVPRYPTDNDFKSRYKQNHKIDERVALLLFFYIIAGGCEEQDANSFWHHRPASFAGICFMLFTR